LTIPINKSAIIADNFEYFFSICKVNFADKSKNYFVIKNLIIK
jgi:hypothetical protein